MKPPSPAQVALSVALAEVAEARITVPCAKDLATDAWFAETLAVRAGAAAECVGCVVFAECDAAASELRPRFGVWAGRDWTWTARKGAAA